MKIMEKLMSFLVVFFTAVIMASTVCAGVVVSDLRLAVECSQFAQHTDIVGKEKVRLSLIHSNMTCSSCEVGEGKACSDEESEVSPWIQAACGSRDEDEAFSEWTKDENPKQLACKKGEGLLVIMHGLGCEYEGRLVTETDEDAEELLDSGENSGGEVVASVVLNMTQNVGDFDLGSENTVLSEIGLMEIVSGDGGSF